VSAPAIRFIKLTYDASPAAWLIDWLIAWLAPIINDIIKHLTYQVRTGRQNNDRLRVTVDLSFVKTAPSIGRWSVTVVVRRQPRLIVGHVLHDERRRHETGRRRSQSQRHPTTERRHVVDSRRSVVVVAAAAAFVSTEDGCRRRLVIHTSWYNDLVDIEVSQVVCNSDKPTWRCYS